MKIKFTTLLVAASFVAAPALAQTPKAASVSLASLLEGGYEVKVITDVSPDEQKSIWPNDTVNPYIMMTWQKGTSVAVCALSMSNWVNLADATLTNATLCKKY